MCLIRLRLLEATRQALALRDGRVPRFGFASSPVNLAEIYVGRLPAKQAVLAAPRRDEWFGSRVAAALELGMIDGSTDTMDILCGVGELDAESSGLVCGPLE